jgi:ABC-type nitrate/sulfonate/bicarbonate transport system substrate-binding protein
MEGKIAMSLEKIRLLCSAVSHMPLIFTFRDSGVTEKYGFELEVDIAGFDRQGKPPRPMSERASLLLDGEYEFLSGLHHQTYVYRAKGDKRFVYLAQTQNSWDDRLIARSEITTLKQLEEKKILNNGNPAPCVMGNLIEALGDAGVDASKIEFVSVEETEVKRYLSLDMVARGEVDAADVDIPFDLIAKKQGLSVLQLPDRPVIHNTTICAFLLGRAMLSGDITAPDDLKSKRIAVSRFGSLSDISTRLLMRFEAGAETVRKGRKKISECAAFPKI